MYHSKINILALYTEVIANQFTRYHTLQMLSSAFLSIPKDFMGFRVKCIRLLIFEPY